ncbi:MAG TPA: CRISPR-associated protein Cas4 [Clostridiales bacterium]|jgi:CRISPR-associated exonuclease Cas4|nr:CRISPR-associated protein Cas4 [Clostridiales bacterium]
MTEDNNWLLLSGIQHYAYCPRQWALIHVEQQWVENVLTASGRIMHERVHKDTGHELRGDVLTVRGLRIASHRLKISGVCDAVEFHQREDGVELKGFRGLWLPFPVEYKCGAPKPHDADRLQLCAQAVCLEEMLLCTINEGALFYGKTRRRERVLFDEPLRSALYTAVERMHNLLKRGHTPKAKKHKSCDACSLQSVCLPALTVQEKSEQYVHRHLMEDAP